MYINRLRSNIAERLYAPDRNARPYSLNLQARAIGEGGADNSGDPTADVGYGERPRPRRLRASSGVLIEHVAQRVLIVFYGAALAVIVAALAKAHRR